MGLIRANKPKTAVGSLPLLLNALFPNSLNRLSWGLSGVLRGSHASQTLVGLSGVLHPLPRESGQLRWSLVLHHACVHGDFPPYLS